MTVYAYINTISANVDDSTRTTMLSLMYEDMIRSFQRDYPDGVIDTINNPHFSDEVVVDEITGQEIPVTRVGLSIKYVEKTDAELADEYDEWMCDYWRERFLFDDD